MTASAYEQQMDKLKPDAFKALLHEFNATMTDVKTMKGLRVYAIDGSDFCTPLNKDSQWYLPNHYIRKDGQEAKGTCQLYGYHKINVQKHSNKEYSENTANTRWDFEEKCVIKFRVCKFTINDPESGKEVWEVLITNLPRDKFSIKDMKRIYWLRCRNLFQRAEVRCRSHKLPFKEG